MRTLSFEVRRYVSLLLLVGLGTGVRAQTPAQSTPRESTTRNPADATACRDQLNRIYEALTRYQKKYKRLPDWLSDLREFVDDPKTFICPFVQSLGDFAAWREGVRGEVFYDPVLNISYGYEFCAHAYALGGGASTTVQEYKKRQTGQMGLFAGEVPIIRCFAHRPILNLSLDGRIYESGVEWEDKYQDFVNISDLLPGALFPSPASGEPEAGQARPRDSTVPADVVDLSPHYTAPLSKTWQPIYSVGNDLANLPEGIARFSSIGVHFDVRGVIQLGGKPYTGAFPEKVDGIKVGRRCDRIHFLHATSYPTTLNAEIGHYQVQYANGEEQKVPIIYGKDVLDWWFDPKHPRSTAQVAWEGVNRAAMSRGRLIRLYHSQWDNPARESEIKCISFVSAMGESAPFLVGITLE